jgi:transposase-like protein
MQECKSVDELARELGVTRRCLYKWRAKLAALQFGEEAARPNTHAEVQRREMLQLKRMLAEKAMEVDFLKGALQKVEARRQHSSSSGAKASTNTSEN